MPPTMAETARRSRRLLMGSMARLQPRQPRGVQTHVPPEDVDRLSRIVEAIDRDPFLRPAEERVPIRLLAAAAAAESDAVTGTGPAPAIAPAPAPAATAKDADDQYLSKKSQNKKLPYTEDPLRYMSAIIEGWGDLMQVMTAVTLLKDRKTRTRRRESEDDRSVGQAPVAEAPEASAGPSAKGVEGHPAAEEPDHVFFFDEQKHGESTSTAHLDHDGQHSAVGTVAGMALMAKRAAHTARTRLSSEKVESIQHAQRTAAASVSQGLPVHAPMSNAWASVGTRTANAVAAQATRQRGKQLALIVQGAMESMMLYFANLDHNVSVTNTQWAAQPLRHVLYPASIHVIIETNRVGELTSLNVADMVRQIWHSCLSAGIVLRAFVGWRELLGSAYVPLPQNLADAVEQLKTCWVYETGAPNMVRNMQEGLTTRGVPAEFAHPFVTELVAAMTAALASDILNVGGSKLALT